MAGEHSAQNADPGVVTWPRPVTPITPAPDGRGRRGLLSPRDSLKIGLSDGHVRDFFPQRCHGGETARENGEAASPLAESS
jgi:hypothetical protein